MDSKLSKIQQCCIIRERASHCSDVSTPLAERSKREQRRKALLHVEDKEQTATGRGEERVAGAHVEERPAMTRTGGGVVQTKGKKKPKLSSKRKDLRGRGKDGMVREERKEIRLSRGRGMVGREGKRKDSEDVTATCGEESVVKESEKDTQSEAKCDHLKKNPTVEVSKLKLTPRTMSKRLLKLRLRTRRKDLARVEVKGDEEVARRGDMEGNREPQEMGAEEGGEREGETEAQGIELEADVVEGEHEGSASRTQRKWEEEDGSEEIAMQSQGMDTQRAWDGENTRLLPMRDVGADGVVEQSITAPSGADNIMNLKSSHRTSTGSTGYAGSTSAHRTHRDKGSSTSEGRKDRRKTLLGEAVVRALKKHGMPRSHQHFRDCYNKLYKIGKTFMEVSYI